MAIKRPQAQEPEPQSADVKFIDKMVRASLSVNSDLRHGQSTSQYLDRMRAQVMKNQRVARGMGAPGEPKAGGAAPIVSDAPSAPGDQSVSMFLDMKSSDLGAAMGEIERERKLLKAKEQEAKERAFEEIVDYITIYLRSGGDSEAAHASLKQNRGLFAQVGKTANDVLRAARKR